jgi:hypothetical protein
MGFLMKTKAQYRHGGAPEFDLRRLNLPDNLVFDFSVNINPLGPPMIVREKWPGFFSAKFPGRKRFHRDDLSGAKGISFRTRIDRYAFIP